MPSQKALVDPGDFAEIGSEVVFHGDHGTLVRGLVADRAISPVTGAFRYCVVASWSESDDPDAGRWIGHDKLFMFHSARTERAKKEASTLSPTVRESWSM